MDLCLNEEEPGPWSAAFEAQTGRQHDKHNTFERNQSYMPPLSNLSLCNKKLPARRAYWLLLKKHKLPVLAFRPEIGSQTRRIARREPWNCSSLSLSLSTSASFKALAQLTSSQGGFPLKATKSKNTLEGLENRMPNFPRVCPSLPGHPPPFAPRPHVRRSASVLRR